MLWKREMNIWGGNSSDILFHMSHSYNRSKVDRSTGQKELSERNKERWVNMLLTYVQHPWWKYEETPHHRRHRDSWKTMRMVYGHCAWCMVHCAWCMTLLHVGCMDESENVIVRNYISNGFRGTMSLHISITDHTILTQRLVIHYTYSWLHHL
jgi:hypothetical protein